MCPENVTDNVKDPKPGTKDALKAENEALSTENEALRAELEALKAKQLTAGAEAKTEPVANADERVEVHVPRGYANDEPNVVISVNGVNYVLPRGKTSLVPKHIAAEFYRSQKAQEALDKRVDEMLEASK